MLGRAVHAGRGYVVLVAGFELDCHRLDVVAFAIFGVRFFVEATVAGCADVVGEVGALRHRDVGFGYDVVAPPSRGSHPEVVLVVWSNTSGNVL